MVVDMYIIGPKKDQFKLVFFSLFDFSKMKRPRPRLQKTNKWSFLVLVLFGLSPVQFQSFASPRTGLSNTNATFPFVCWNIMQKQAVSCNSFFSMKASVHHSLLQQVTNLAPFLTDIMNKWVQDLHAMPTTDTEKAVLSLLQQLQLTSHKIAGSVGYKLCW